MPIIYTENLAPSEGSRQVYNGLDCCITSEVLGVLQQQFNQSPIIYDFERALQAPALEMMLRGFRVDNIKRLDMIGSLQLRLSKLQNILDRYAYAVWDKPLNPNSPKQLIDFFYHKMKLPEQFSHKKGQTKLSTDREALEALELYFYARPIVACILAIRDLKKQLSVLETEIDSDMRMRTSYNIAGTETGRWSSSSSAYGVGTNLQNIARDLRIIFVSDPGMKLYGIDLEQAESREVGWLSGTILGDWSYLDACLSSDLHTTVARMAYPNLAWTGDAKKDRVIAEQIVYRTYSYRDLSKKLGHGSNYYGKPATMARHAKIPVKDAEFFQSNYFAGFPGIPKWHRWTAQQIQTTHQIETVFGRRRHFFGRPNDDATLREAIAFAPQGATGDRMNLGLWRLWKHMGKEIQLLGQVHDAVYFQAPDRGSEYEADVIKRALALIEIPMTDPKSGRTYTVPGEAKTGWNWGDFNDDAKRGPLNPEGLKKFKGSDTRVRLEGLDRRM
jgi:DNA polymerase-1